MKSQSDNYWLNLIHEIGPSLQKESKKLDEEYSFVYESYELLKQHKFFSALIPEELGGGGLAYEDLCQVLRALAAYCPSTSLASSMHHHLVASSVWKYKKGMEDGAFLRKIAEHEFILVSTGAKDFLESSGDLVKTEGGYLMTAKKHFASQSLVGDYLITSARYVDPKEGSRVLHFPLPVKHDGVTVMNDWRTLGMRSTGSHTVAINNAFIPETTISLNRPAEGWPVALNVGLTNAMPIIMSVYIGIAEKAANIVLESLKRRQEAKTFDIIEMGLLHNELNAARIQVKEMIQLVAEFTFEATYDLAQTILSLKTNVAEACVGVVTRAMAIAGGPGYYEVYGLEKLFRDVQGANYHPLQKKEQVLFFGTHILNQKD